MAKQRIVSTKFWSDPWIVDELNPLDRYLFLYLLTNEKTTVVGVYELSLRTMANETGLDKEEINRMLMRLDSRVLYVDGWVVFRNAIRHQNYNSPKIHAAIARELKFVPPNVAQYISMPESLKKSLSEKHGINIQPLPLLEEYGIDTVSIPRPYGIDTQSHLNLNFNLNSNLNSNSNLATLSSKKINKKSSAKSLPAKPAKKPKAAVAAAPKVAKVPSKDVNDLFDYWEDRVGYRIQSKVIANRRAASNLAKKFGVDEAKRLVDGVALSHADKFAPRIADFSQLQQKLSDLIAWGKRRGTSHAAARF